MRIAIFCAVFLLSVTAAPASSALIPYTITGDYFDRSTGLTHQVFGSIIIENQPSQYGWIFNWGVAPPRTIEIPAGSGSFLKDVLDLPTDLDWSPFIMTHYYAYSFSLTSLNDPGVSWYQDAGWFRFESYSFQNFYPADKYSNILSPTVPDLRYYFYYSDMTPYSDQDWWSWHHDLAPVIKAHDLSFSENPGVDPHGPDGKGSYMNLTLTRSVPVPEPTALLLFGSGLLGLAAVGRRKRSRSIFRNIGL